MKVMTESYTRGIFLPDGEHRWNPSMLTPRLSLALLVTGTHTLTYTHFPRDTLEHIKHEKTLI